MSDEAFAPIAHCSLRITCYSGKAEALRLGDEGFDGEGDMLVEVEAEFLRALRQVLPVDGPRERLVLHLLAHRLRVHVRDPLRGTDERDRTDETGQFVHREERVLH